jgi:HIV Tat-specific factor 1
MVESEDTNNISNNNAVENGCSRDSNNNDGDETNHFDVQLRKVYYYQNNLTGAISATPLTTRQLCLMLSPSSAPVTTAAASVVNADTLAIGWNTESHSYAADWLPCRNIPILREACSNWHYQDTFSGEVRGPVTTRVLASMLFSHSENTTSDNVPSSTTATDDDGGNCATLLDENTKVWSAEIAAQENCNNTESNTTTSTTQWRRIADDPYLRIALRAFSKISDSLQSQEYNDMIADNQVFYPDDMVNNTASDDVSPSDEQQQRMIHPELDVFFAQEDENAEEYESDGGTYYIRESESSEWRKHTQGLAVSKLGNNYNNRVARSTNMKTLEEASPHHEQLINTNKKRKHHKAKFRAKNAAKWIYVTGLPRDTNEEEVEKHFSRVGIIELDPETQHPKIKLYRHKGDDGTEEELKGDASICYAREESVDLAFRILDEGYFRPTAKTLEGMFPLAVTPAKFEKKGDVILQANKPRVAEAKRKVAKLAAMQAIGWDEGDNGRITGGLKGLRIVVLKHMFTLSMLQTDETILDKLERQIRKECSELGDVEKITVFSKNPQGVILVKFVQPAAATEAVKLFHGKCINGQKVDACYWDGITDFTIYDDATDDAEQRIEEFGQWLESQELPEEFKLRVEK